MELELPRLQAQFNKMCATGKLFRSTLTGRQVWELYITGFGEDPIFRDPESSVHNCNLCKNFVHRYGNIVALDENLDIVTLFDYIPDDEYKESFRRMSEALRSSGIESIFVETFNMLNTLPYETHIHKNAESFCLGISKNIKRYTKEEAEKFGVVKPNELRTFHHLSVRIPNRFISKTSDSAESLIGEARASKEVFKRAMDEIPEDTLKLVRDLIVQGSLLNGEAHLNKIDGILPKVIEYKRIPENKKDLWCWLHTDFKYARFRNELIGVLCTELAEGKDLNAACQDWNKRVDPANYMKAKAPVTKQMIEQAKQFVQENGYEESFQRRMATIDDIAAANILHLASGDGSIKPISVFDNIKPTSTRHKRAEFDKVEEVSIEKFMKDILPSCTSVEAFLLNSHKRNMVTMTTSVNKDSKRIFKWDNNFSWTYEGNLAGKSEIREEVKKAGGVVDAPFRFSIMWNEDGRDIVDLDAHCVETGRILYEIMFRNKGIISPCGGILDVDMINPSSKGVENIYYNTIHDGTYRFFIHNYNGRSHKNCKAEIFFNGDLYTYYIDHKIIGSVDIASVTIKNGEITDIKQSKYLVDSNAISSEIYGLETNKFHKVNLVCLSPNHWSIPVGNKHYFFMLEGCKPCNNLRAFHNENLIPELLEHRKVMEVLGTTAWAEPVANPLSGLGFNATVRDELIVRLKGSHNRVIKIKF